MACSPIAAPPAMARAAIMVSVLLERRLLDHVAGTQHAFVGAADIDREHDQTLHVRLDLEFFAQAGDRVRRARCRRCAHRAGRRRGAASALSSPLATRAPPSVSSKRSILAAICHAAAVADDLDRDGGADLRFADHARERAAIGDVAAVEAQHDVAGAQACRCGRAVGRDARDDGAALRRHSRRARRRRALTLARRTPSQPRRVSP